MANFSSGQKYLDKYGLSLFWDKVRQYIQNQIGGIDGTDIKLYPSGETNPTVTDQIEKLWNSIGSGLGQYVKDIQHADSQTTPLKVVVDEGIGDNAGFYTVTLEDNGLANTLSDLTSNRVSSLDPVNGGGSVTLTVDKNKGDVTLTINSQELTNKVSGLETTINEMVKSVDKAENGDGTYVKLNIDPTTGDVKLSINDQSLVSELTSIKEDYVKTEDLPTTLPNPHELKVIDANGTPHNYNGEETVDLSGGINYAANSGKLGGQSSSYYGKQSDITDISQKIAELEALTHVNQITTGDDTSDLVKICFPNSTGNVVASIDETNLSNKLTSIDNYTINSKKISTSPVLTGSDITLGNSVGDNDNYPITTTLTSSIQKLRQTIAGLGQVVKLKGVLTSLPTTTSGYGNGDVIIVGNKEYICYESQWHLLGDTTELSQDVSTIKSSYVKSIKAAGTGVVVTPSTPSAGDVTINVDATSITEKIKELENNFGNYLSLSGGTISGGITINDIYGPSSFSRNIYGFQNTAGFARDVVNIKVDDVYKFGIGGHGVYKPGATDNDLIYAYIGCNAYDGLNLRINKSSIKWGTNDIIHSGNIKSTLGISDWALAATKPSYTASEVGATPSFGDVGANSVKGNGLGYTYATSAHGGHTAGGFISFGNTVYGCQLNGSINGDKLAFRGLNNGTFTSWKQLAFTSDIPTKLSQLTDDVVDGKYLPITGGIINTAATTPLNIKNTQSNPTEVGIRFMFNNDSKAWLGYNTQNGINLYTYNGAHRLGLKDDGTAHLDSNTLIHSGNIGSYNAGSADFANKLNAEYLADLNNGTRGRLFYSAFQAANTPPAANYFAGLTFGYDSIKQLAMSYDGYLYTRYSNKTTWSNWKKVAFTDSNVASATKLQTPRKLWGNDFDGTADVNGIATISGSDRDLYWLCKGSQYELKFGIGNGNVNRGIYDGTLDHWWIRRASTADTYIEYGNVGIGNSSPTEKLDVTGNVKANGFIGNASSATVFGSNDFKVYAENSNEINFGGTAAKTNVYFGYRDKDGIAVPQNYYFGSSGGANVRAGAFCKKDSSNSYVLLGGGAHKSLSDFSKASWSTFTPAETALTNDDVLSTTGEFSLAKGSWYYAGNGYLPAGEFGNIDLAGCSVLTFGGNSGGAYTQLFITSPAPMGSNAVKANEILFYNNHGEGYSPGWTRVLTNRNYTEYIPTSLPWSSITSKPTFATVATSGSYNDLTNKPTIPTIPSSLPSNGIINAYSTYGTNAAISISQAIRFDTIMGEDLLGSGKSTGYNNAILSISRFNNDQYTTQLGFSGNGIYARIFNAKTPDTTTSWRTMIMDDGAGRVTANAFYINSDERLKTFGDDIKVDFDELAKLRKSHFVFNDNPTKQEIGVSAQEVQKIYPEIVNETEEGTLSVDYSKLAVVALAAIDKLNQRVQELENKLSKYE